MPHFFFHIRERDKLTTDPEGEEHQDLEQARAEAVTAAREIMAEKVVQGEIAEGEQFEICDAAGAVLAVIPFEEAIKLPSP